MPFGLGLYRKDVWQNQGTKKDTFKNNLGRLPKHAYGSNRPSSGQFKPWQFSKNTSIFTSQSRCAKINNLKILYWTRAAEKVFWGSFPLAHIRVSSLAETYVHIPRPYTHNGQTREGEKSSSKSIFMFSQPCFQFYFVLSTKATTWTFKPVSNMYYCS